MRILHTSDWHLGRSFHGVDLLEAQAAHLDHLVETVRTEDVDLVLVSGDVYDRALPPLGAAAEARVVAMRSVGMGGNGPFDRMGSGVSRRHVDSASHAMVGATGFEPATPTPPV